MPWWCFRDENRWWEGVQDNNRQQGEQPGVGLTLQCVLSLLRVGWVHGLRGSLATPNAVSAGTSDIRFSLSLVIIIAFLPQLVLPIP